MRRVVTLVLFFALVAIVIHSWMTSQLITRETLFPTDVSAHHLSPDLERVVNYEAINASWTATLKHVGEEFEVDFQIDSSTFEDLKIDGTEKVGIRVENIPLKSLIRQVLRQVDSTLDFFNEDGTIVVTTIDKLEESSDGPNWSKRIYPLADVIESAPHAITEEDLVDVLYMIAPHIWDESGGSATIQRLPGHMHVHAPQFVHRDIERLLTGLREQFESVSAPEIRDTTTNERHNKVLQEVLSQRMDVDVVDQPLDKLAQEWSDRFQIPILLDFGALENEGLSPDTKLSIANEQTAFGKVLERILSPYGLEYYLDNGVILISTEEYGWENLPITIYPVQDLIDATNLENDSFEELILDSVLADQWEDLGGPAAMNLISGQLVVSHFEKGHKKLANFLDMLRRNLHSHLPTQLIARDEIEDRKTIEKTLGVRTTLKFYEEEELSDILLRIREEVGLKYWVDQLGLSTEEINTQLPLDLEFKDELVETIVHELLRNCDNQIIYGLEHDTLVITVEGYSTPTAEFRMYPANDILVNSNPPISIDEILNTIQLIESPESWYDYGGENFAIPLGQNLLVKQQRPSHQNIAQLLNQIREMSVDDSRMVATVPSGFGHDHAALYEKLQQQAKIDADGASVREIFDVLESSYGVKINITNPFQYPRVIKYQKTGRLGHLLWEMMSRQSCQIKNGRINMVDPQEVLEQPLIRIYRIPSKVADLFAARGVIQLATIIRGFVSTPEWSQNSDPISEPTVMGEILVARCSLESHSNIEIFLDTLDKHLTTDIETQIGTGLDVQHQPFVTLTNWTAPTYFTRLYPIGHLRDLYPAKRQTLPYIPIAQEQILRPDAGFTAWRDADPIAQAVNACLPAVIKGVVSDSVQAITIGNTLILHTEQRSHAATEKMLLALEKLPSTKANLLTIEESNAALVQIKAEIGYSPKLVKRIAMARISPNEWAELGGSENIIALDNFLVVPIWTIETDQFMNLLVWLFEQPNLLSKARSGSLADRQTAMNTLANWIASDDENKVAYAAAVAPLLDDFTPTLSDAIAAKFLDATDLQKTDVPFGLLLAESLPKIGMPEVARDPAMLNLLKKTKPGTYKRRKWLEVANNLANSVALQTAAFQSATTSEIIFLLENLTKYRESHDVILQAALKRLADKVLIEDHFNSYSFIRNIVLEYDPDLKLIQQQIDKLRNDPTGGERANTLRYRLIGYHLMGGGGIF